MFKCVKKQKYVFSLASLLIIFTLQACGLTEISKQTDMLASAGVISGEVAVQGDASGPIYVQLYTRVNGVVKLIDKNALQSDGFYSFSVLPGSYSVATFLDTDGDGTYKDGLWATYYGQDTVEPKALYVAAGEEVDVPKLIIKSAITSKPDVNVEHKLGKTNRNIGRIISLEDPMFGRDYASMGLWRPFDFVDEVGGGLMMLQEYDADKVPLLLIHGIGGTSTEFNAIVNSIDHEHYQPWVLYYPSGVSLDLVSNYMIEALQQLSHRYDFKELAIIAHSMGGLMLRSYVMKQQLSNTAYDLKFVVTINSPLYGMSSATSGVRYSPIVVRAWIDVARGSEYVKRVLNWSWPDTVPYHLVFSYLPGEDGDGVVPLNSQLSLSLQREATKIHGFEAQHAGVLKEPDFLDELNKILNSF